MYITRRWQTLTIIFFFHWNGSRFLSIFLRHFCLFSKSKTSKCLSALLLSATQLGCTSVTFYLFTGVHTHGLSSQRVLSSFDNCWQLRFGETLLWYSLPHYTLFFCQNKLHCCNNTHGDCLKIGIWCSFYYYLTPRLYLFSASFSQFQPVSAHFRPLFILWQI